MSILDGASAWSEHDWIGSDITLGAARLRVILPITRCAATQVNPVTARRDLDIVAALGRAFGHINMGVYAEVVAPTRSPSAMRCSSRKGIRRAVDTIYLNISKGVLADSPFPPWSAAALAVSAVQDLQRVAAATQARRHTSF
jgi:hypothetical protein